MTSYKAKLTSKNQLTLPAGVSALLHARPGDTLNFTVDEPSGEVRVTGPDIAERLRSWSGRWIRDGKGMTREETDAWIREVRGPRE